MAHHPDPRMGWVTERFLIDECCVADLVVASKKRGYLADYVPHIGKQGWQDWNLVPFAIESDYIIVSINRKDFLKTHALLEMHPGLVILIPQPPNNRRADQVRLFDKALDLMAELDDRIVNRVIEVANDGKALVREWSSADNDPEHISNPRWS